MRNNDVYSTVALDLLATLGSVTIQSEDGNFKYIAIKGLVFECKGMANSEAIFKAMGFFAINNAVQTGSSNG